MSTNRAPICSNIVMVVVALLFMVILSWRLSLVAFTSVPAVVVVSTWYDNYIKEIAKSSQVRKLGVTISSTVFSSSKHSIQQ